MMKRPRLAAACLAAGALGACAIGTAGAQAAPKKLTIVSEGKNTVKPNRYFQSALFFTPGTATVQTGAPLVVKDKDKSGEPHTITFVKKADYPTKFEDYLNCEACNTAITAHGLDGPPSDAGPTLTVNEGGTGIDAPGDSLYFDPEVSAKSKITAKAGSTLYFVCAVHPWMQGKLKVTK